MFGERVRQSLRAPQKHSAVPIKIPRPNEFSRALSIRLLGETQHVAGVSGGQRSCLDIAVTSLRTRRLDTEHHNVFARPRNCDAFSENFAKTDRKSVV